MTHYTPNTDRSVFGLANLADSYSPDNRESAGAAFLTSIRDDLADSIGFAQHSGDEIDANDLSREIADSAVPIYTNDLWATFVDLGAYTEDPSELGYDTTSHMETLARVCLYIIAERLVGALLGEWESAEDEDSQDHESYTDDQDHESYADDDEDIYTFLLPSGNVKIVSI